MDWACIQRGKTSKVQLERVTDMQMAFSSAVITRSPVQIRSGPHILSFVDQPFFSSEPSLVEGKISNFLSLGDRLPSVNLAKDLFPEEK
jgi:hypothetical protein